MDLNVDLRGCIAGRKDAWDAFVCASAPVIYAAVQRSMRARSRHQQTEIDDRVQDVYVRLLREGCKLLRQFDPTRASLVTWISLIARTVVHEHFQKKTLATAPMEAVEFNPGHASVSSVRHEHAPVPLEVLTDQQRQVIGMLFDQNLTVEQAAARLGVDPQTIRSAKHKALSRLREVVFRPKTEPQQDHDPPRHH